MAQQSNGASVVLITLAGLVLIGVALVACAIFIPPYTRKREIEQAQHEAARLEIKAKSPCLDTVFRGYCPHPRHRVSEVAELPVCVCAAMEGTK